MNNITRAKGIAARVMLTQATRVPVATAAVLYDEVMEDWATGAIDQLFERPYDKLSDADKIYALILSHLAILNSLEQENK